MAQPIRQRFCQLVKTARLQKGLTQKALGIIVGYPEEFAQQRISRIESGQMPIPIEKVRAMAMALDLPL